MNKLELFSFEHNFRKYCPLLIFFHCCRQKLPAHKHTIEFPTLPIVCCCTTLKHTSFMQETAPAPAGGGGRVQEGLAPRRKFWPPTRIYKVILQETTATTVLYTLPAVEVRQLVINGCLFSQNSKKYFHHLKGRGYNTHSPYYIHGPLDDENILLFYMCHFAMGLTHCYKTTVFLHLYLQFFY